MRFYLITSSLLLGLVLLVRNMHTGGNVSKFENVQVNTDGQAALFSTFGGLNGNVWIGGGGQSFGGAVFPGTGQNTALGIAALQNVTTGNGDTCIGFEAGGSLTTGYTTTAV